jgi:hypothetical protein
VESSTFEVGSPRVASGCARSGAQSRRPTSRTTCCRNPGLRRGDSGCTSGSLGWEARRSGAWRRAERRGACGPGRLDLSLVAAVRDAPLRRRSAAEVCSVDHRLRLRAGCDAQWALRRPRFGREHPRRASHGDRQGLSTITSPRISASIKSNYCRRSMRRADVAPRSAELPTSRILRRPAPLIMPCVWRRAGRGTAIGRGLRSAWRGRRRSFA